MIWGKTNFFFFYVRSVIKGIWKILQIWYSSKIPLLLIEFLKDLINEKAGFSKGRELTIQFFLFLFIYEYAHLHHICFPDASKRHQDSWKEDERHFLWAEGTDYGAAWLGSDPFFSLLVVGRLAFLTSWLRVASELFFTLALFSLLYMWLLTHFAKDCWS